MIEHHVIQDLDSRKIYAINGHNSNALIQIMGSKKSLVKFNTEKNIFKNQEKANFNDEGSFWIGEELNCYQTFDNFVFETLDGDITVKAREIININPENDISLLSEATFIYGYAKFDTKEETMDKLM